MVSFIWLAQSQQHAKCPHGINAVFFLTCKQTEQGFSLSSMSGSSSGNALFSPNILTCLSSASLFTYTLSGSHLFRSFFTIHFARTRRILRIVFVFTLVCSIFIGF